MQFTQKCLVKFFYWGHFPWKFLRQIFKVLNSLLFEFIFLLRVLVCKKYFEFGCRLTHLGSLDFKWILSNNWVLVGVEVGIWGFARFCRIFTGWLFVAKNVLKTINFILFGDLVFATLEFYRAPNVLAFTDVGKDLF